jgi:ATP-dependent DNA helicase RecQ
MLYGLGDIRMRRMFIDEEDTSDDHKRRQHQRLAALIGYCEAATCRRRTLLAYFGESAEPCGNCDACLEPAAMLDATAAAQLILNLVQQTGERYGAAHIVDVLSGDETEKVIACRHDQFAAFGAGATRKKGEWRSLIRQLVAGGFLVHDVAGYGGLALAPDGKAVLKGTARFMARAEQPRRSSRKERAAAAAATLDDSETELFAALKRLRLTLAARRRVAAYLIFSDKTLQEMARKAPRDLEAFAEISGVGTSKLRDFGQIFLDAIAAHGES